ncbi:hypothetical protein QCI42_29905 [Bacillus fungorum]|uniref:hypothetical protein n=1 Tax=Bacillus fungorum TaxID=2039284 RepID=UPI0033911574
MFKKGDKVIMHTCDEANYYYNRIWTCKTDEFVKGKGMYKQNLVFLEGFSGSFLTEYLRKSN